MCAQPHSLPAYISSASTQTRARKHARVLLFKRTTVVHVLLSFLHAQTLICKYFYSFAYVLFFFTYELMGFPCTLYSMSFSSLNHVRYSIYAHVFQAAYLTPLISTHPYFVALSAYTLPLWLLGLDPEEIQVGLGRQSLELTNTALQC